MHYTTTSLGTEVMGKLLPCLANLINTLYAIIDRIYFSSFLIVMFLATFSMLIGLLPSNWGRIKRCSNRSDYNTVLFLEF